MKRATSVTHLHILAVVETELGGRPPGAASAPLQVLDAGCGDGALMAYLQAGLDELRAGDSVEVHGFDVDDSLTEHVSTAGETIANLRELSPETAWDDRVQIVSVTDAWPFPDAHFDVVVSNQVLEHVADLDAFFAELERTLRPGGFSVHVFPLRRTLMEWHLKVPVVHLIEDHRIRARAIDVLSRLGLGTYPEARAHHGLSTAAYGRTRADFIQFGTFYRSWREVARAAKHARLSTTHRYTRGLYLQKARTLLARRAVYRYERETAPFADWLSFVVLPQLATVTLVVEKPPVQDTWRAPEHLA